jgi:ribosomal protein S18 acetylase RimI-like enzyme
MEQAKVQIRAARLEDCQALAHVQVDSYRTAYAGILPQSYLDHFTFVEEEADWQRLISSGGDEILLVAETGAGEVVGYVLARPGPSNLPKYEGELVALHVRPPFQRQGIGRRLVAAAAGHLRSRGCSSMKLWVLADNPSRGFYERLGGQPIAQKSISVDESDFRAVEVAYGWMDIGVL